MSKKRFNDRSKGFSVWATARQDAANNAINLGFRFFINHPKPLPLIVVP
jgi:hypothetical protein